MDITVYVVCVLFGALLGYRVRDARDMEDE